jgi:hypothetical protein
VRGSGIRSAVLVTYRPVAPRQRRQHRALHPQIAEARLRRSDLVENVISSEQLKSSLVRNFRQRGASNGASSAGRENLPNGGRRTWATLDNNRRRFFVGHPKAINRTEIAQAATNVRSQVIPISALAKATNSSPLRKRSNHRRQLFIRSKGNPDRLDDRISLGAFTLAQWLFS